MSDRVRFGTVNDTVNPELSSGFSGFPFPVPEFDTEAEMRAVLGADEFLFPIGVDLFTALKWFWKVKKWSVVVDAFADLSGDGCGEVTMEFAGEVSRPGVLGELGLALPPVPYFQNVTGDWTITPEPISGPATVVVYADLFGAIAASSPDVPPVCRVGSLYFPQMFLEAEWSDAGFDGGCTTGIHEIRHMPEGTSIITLDGLEIPAEIDDWNVAFAITPSEYWPYAGADTNPIYDTTTGELLPGRNPLM